MSAERIDVLAVIDAEIAFIREGIGRGDEMVHLEMTRHERVKVAEIRAGLMERLARTQDARAAVAELIEAAKKAEAMIRGTDAEHLAVDAAARVGLGEYLRAAIARAQGEGV